MTNDVADTNHTDIKVIQEIMARQVVFFNRIFLFLTIALIIITVVIIGLTYNVFVNSNSIAGLKFLITDTITKTQPDRDAQNLSREILREHYETGKVLNQTITENNKMLKMLLSKHP